MLSKSIRTAILGIAASAALLVGVKAASAEAALLIDADSGRVLYAENAASPWYPASVTKIMTAYVILRAVKEGRISLDKLLTVSENAVAQQPSKMGFPLGTQVTVDNALKMLMVKSANDMAVVLAEGLSGSIENFATEMNRAAQRLGMTQTSYVNPNGLPADGQVTSARDLAILARAAIREMPEYGLYWHISAIKFGKRVMRNYNTLIDRYPGADGMKTGFICASGFNLVATATRGSRRLIAVVLGSRSGMQRAEKAAQLLERGFTGGGGLSWLIPSFGTVDALQPVDASPPNLRDEICNAKGRRKWAPSDNDEEPVAHTAEESGSPLAMMAGFQLGPAKHGSLIGPLQPSMAPIPVYTGPARSPEAVEQLASAPAVKKKQPPKAAAQPGAPSSRHAATSGNGDAKAKPPPAAQRPAGSSSHAAPAKPSVAAEKGPSADPAHAAKPKPKPKAKPAAAKQPNNG
ncbi:MAG: serine hydrolase [Xanthobacteraceae bacterium]